MEDPKNIKEELTEDELNGVSGGDGGNWNGNGSLKEEFEFTDDELKGVTGGSAEAMKGPLRKLSTVVDVDEINFN